MGDFIVEVNILYLSVVAAAAWFSYRRGYKEGYGFASYEIGNNIHTIVHNIVQRIIEDANLTEDEKKLLEETKFEVEYDEK